MKASRKDSVRQSWTDNMFVHTQPNGCSALKKLLGNEVWNTYTDSLGLKKRSCPLPVVRSDLFLIRE